MAEVIQVKPDWLPLIPALATPPNQKSTIWVQLPALSIRWSQHKGTSRSFVEIKHLCMYLMNCYCVFFLHADRMQRLSVFTPVACSARSPYFAHHQLSFLIYGPIKSLSTINHRPPQHKSVVVFCFCTKLNFGNQKACAINLNCMCKKPKKITYMYLKFIKNVIFGTLWNHFYPESVCYIIVIFLKE